jgi:hypothetical protein
VVLVAQFRSLLVTAPMRVLLVVTLSSPVALVALVALSSLSVGLAAAVLEVLCALVLVALFRWTELTFLLLLVPLQPGLVACSRFLPATVTLVSVVMLPLSVACPWVSCLRIVCRAAQ